MRRLARIGIGAGLLAGLAGIGAGALNVRRRLADRRSSRRAEAAEARRNLWPPVPLKPGTEARIDAERVSGEPG